MTFTLKTFLLFCMAQKTITWLIKFEFTGLDFVFAPLLLCIPPHCFFVPELWRPLHTLVSFLPLNPFYYGYQLFYLCPPFFFSRALQFSHSWPLDAGIHDLWMLELDVHACLSRVGLSLCTRYWVCVLDTNPLTLGSALSACGFILAHTFLHFFTSI